MQDTVLRESDIPDWNLFMMCEKLNPAACSSVPEGYYIRTCKEEELDVWKGFPFDTAEEKREYRSFMDAYFEDVYGAQAECFFKQCLFVCEAQTDKPVATCFLWRAYGKLNTIHWLKTLKEYEGRGIGRALLSHILAPLKAGDYPVYLHTQPGSYRAVGLYSSFGFQIVTNAAVGFRENHYKQSLPILKQFMKPEYFEKLKFITAPDAFDQAAKSTEGPQF